MRLINSQQGEQKRLAIIGTRGFPSYYGGFETAVRNLSPYLAERGWSVTVYCREDSVLHEPNNTYPGINQAFTWGLNSKSLSTLSYGFSSAIDAKRKRFDAALVMNVANGYFLPLLRQSGIPTLVNVDGIEWEREKWGRLAKSVFKTGAALTAKYADELVFDSKVIEERWKKDYMRSGNYIPYGADYSEVVAFQEQGFKQGHYVLFVARFVPENTIQEFLQAAQILAERNINVVIVGSTGYGGIFDIKAQELSAKYREIHWLGHLSDDPRLFSLWANAGAYFHGHSVGGTNPALVQAMAKGAPTVARDTLFNREVLGTAGIFVQPNPEVIANALISVLNDSLLQTSLRERARTRAKRYYTWRKVNQKYEDALLRLANRPNKL